MSYYPGTFRLKCDMTHECAATVTHVDEKGFVYCRTHGIARKDFRRCRQLTAREIKTLTAGSPIHYERARNLEVTP